jgi:hypothetical protein
MERYIEMGLKYVVGVWSGFICIRTQWWVLINTVMNLRVNKRRGILDQLSGYQLLMKNFD